MTIRVRFHAMTQRCTNNARAPLFFPTEQRRVNVCLRARRPRPPRVTCSYDIPLITAATGAASRDDQRNLCCELAACFRMHEH